MTNALIRSKRFIHRLAAFCGLLLWCLGSQAEHYAIPLFAPAGPSGAPQGVLRILNGEDESGTVAIWAIDDAGERYGPATFTLGTSAAAEFDASDLVSGNAAKGLSGGIGPLAGVLRLEIDTDIDIVPLAYARAADGTLSAMHDTVPAAADAQSPGEATGEASPYRYEVPVFNPASDVSQASRLRLINPGDAPAAAIIEGRDDSGAAASGGSVRLTIPAGAARTLTALQLEAGGEGLAGRLGAGTGRWRLTVSSDRPLQAVNIAADGTGWRWNNLSTVAAPGPASAPVPEPASGLARISGLEQASGLPQAQRHTIPLFAPAGTPGAPQGLLRILNRADEAATVEIWAIDDAGIRTGPATFKMNALAAAEFDALDLVSGNAAKGLTGGVGPVAGDLRLEIDTDLDIVPLAYARAADGALSAMHDTVPAATGVAASGDAVAEASSVATGDAAREAHAHRYHVPMFNPASEAAQASRLRLINPGDAPAAVLIEGRDDTGAAAPGGNVRLTLPAGAARTLTALQLEAGGAGLAGRLGSGTGRWRLTVSSDRLLQTVNAAASGAGHLNNLSTVAAETDGAGVPADFDLDEDNERAEGATWANGRVYVVDSRADKVFAYTLDGQRDAAADFDLDGDNRNPTGIAWSGSSFHVVDGSADKVFAYGADGQRQASADFDLHDDNGRAEGIVWANDRIHVVDRGSPDKVFVYGADGSRDASAEFGLDGGNRNPSGIAWADGRFYVADSSDRKVYVHGADGQRDASADFDLNDGNAAAMGIVWADGPFLVPDEDGLKVFAYAGPVVPGDGTPPDAQPSFAADSAPDDLTYTVGAAIGALTLPAASGGDGTLTYTLTPTVPGLSFDAATRQLGGTPTAAGTYSMTYTATDADGDAATLNFAIAVQAATGGVVPTDFELDGDNGRAEGVAWANGRVYVVDSRADKVFAYGADGQRDESADFDLHGDNRGPTGIAWSGTSLHVVDGSADKVFAYGPDGQRQAEADFDLHDDNGRAEGIVWANDLFFVVDRGSPDKVYAYGADGARDESADFDLDGDNRNASGIAWADGRFYVADSTDGKVYAYGADGQRDATADFDLNDGNAAAMGIVWADGPFLVADEDGRRVHAYAGPMGPGGGTPPGGETTYGAGDMIDSLPVGSWEPDETSGARVTSGADGTRVEFDDGGYIEVGGHRYTCRGADGCEIANGSVVSGTIIQTPVSDTPPDLQPSFADGSNPGDQTYKAGAAIDPLTLPEASGGDGTLQYSLTAEFRFGFLIGSDIPGLSFDAATRQLTGTPLHLGTYDMWWSVVDGDGDRDYLFFTITVEQPNDAYGNVPEIFQLHLDNGRPSGIAFADGRLYVTDLDDGTVYAYRDDGERDFSVEFDLQEFNTAPLAIANADGWFYVTEAHRPVFVYGNDEQRVVFQHIDNLWPLGIAYSDDRLYVLDGWGDRKKVFVYRDTGELDFESTFDLHEDNTAVGGIAYANGRLYVTDYHREKVFAYRETGERDPSADFYLHYDNSSPTGIDYADGRFFVVEYDTRKVFVYRYSGQVDGDDREPTTYEGGETIPGLPGGTWVPDFASDARFASGADGTRIEFDHGGYFEHGGYRYTCRSAAGCEIAGGDIVSGTIIRTPSGVAAPDTQPSFAAGSDPGNRLYTAGADIGTSRLPSADGGEGTLTYTLTPTVPGLTFNAASRRLTGTPAAPGRYDMTYTVTDSDGDTDTVSFSISVLAAVKFDLHDSNSGSSYAARAITHANGRFYIADAANNKVYAYTEAWERDASADFDLDGENSNPTGIAWAEGRFYVADWDDGKVYAYGADGQRDASADLDIAARHGIFWANDRFYILYGFEVQAYRADGQRDAAADFELHDEDHFSLGVSGITYVNDRFYVAQGQTSGIVRFQKVFAYRADGQRDAAADFELHDHNGQPAGIVHVGGSFYVLDSEDRKVYAYSEDERLDGEGGYADATERFDLDVELDNIVYRRGGIAYADSRFYIVVHVWNDVNSSFDAKVYAYRADGQRDAAADFDLHQDNNSPRGMVYADGLFYVVNHGGGVFAYRADGERVAAVEFNLEGSNDPAGIAYVDGRFYLPDQYEDRPVVFAYHANGQLDVVASIILHEHNGDYAGIAYANDRFHVLDSHDRKVYAYGRNEERDAAADFDLHDDNSDPNGIVYGDGWFYVFDTEDNRVYAYPETAYGVGDTISALPTGSWTPLVYSPGTRFTNTANGTRIEFDRGAFIEVDRYHYSCRSAGGCEVTGGAVVSGTIVRTPDTQPSFAAGSVPSNLTYAAGEAVEALSLPLASGGDGALTYTLTPSVPGLSFDAATRRLTGTPTEAGTYEMSFSVTDADGDTATLSLTVTVTDAAEAFDLHMTHYRPDAITFGDGRFYVADYRAGKVYIYRENGQRVAASDFDLREVDSRHPDPDGIAYGNGRFYVVNYRNIEGVGTYKVDAYRENGQRDAASDFELHDGVNSVHALAYANGRFYVVGEQYVDGSRIRKVFVYGADGQHDASAGFDLHEDNDYPRALAYVDNRFYVADFLDGKVYAYRADGQRDAASDFDFDAEHDSPRGFTYANGLFHSVDAQDWKVYAYRSGGQRDETGDFDLGEDSGVPRGIAHADGRFFVVNWFLRKVHVYRDTWERDMTADFELHEENVAPSGIAYAGGQIYVVDGRKKVFAYRAGGRDASADFDLHEDNGAPWGIVWAGERLYVLDWSDNKVYAYREGGERDMAVEFDLHGENGSPAGIAYAGGRFYVVDSRGHKVFAYREDGQRDAPAEFSLHVEPGNVGKIAYANGQFYVLDIYDTMVYAHASPLGPDVGDDGQGTAFATGDTVFGLPTGTWMVDAVSGTNVTSGADATRVEIDNGGYIETDGFRFSCQGAGDCEIDNGVVVSGTIVRMAAEAPGFRTGSGPGELTYSVGTAIDALTLPMGSGAGSLTYGLTPSVPGLSFDPATRRLTGTPSAAGTYAMTYTVANAGGRTATLFFDIDVISVAKTFELREESIDPSGIAYSNGRFHVVYHDHSKVYAYRADGQRDATADFDLHVSSRNPLGITTAGDRFLVVNFNSVRAFHADGRRDPDSDFYLDVENDNPGGIVHANGRFYIVDARDNKVYAYRADGQRDPDADFNLDEENGFSTGIAHANGLFYVMDLAAAKAYAYRTNGQREASSDFGVDGDNARPRGIAHAENWFSVVSRESVGPVWEGEWVNKVYVYPHKGRYSPATHRIGDTISGLPGGTWVPAVSSAARSASDANGTRIALDDGGYVEEGGHRYSCRGAGGCEIANRIVVSGAILQTVAGQPGFHSGSLPGELTFVPGSAIDALTLPAAGGGDGTLTYSLAPSVPGLSFDPATRRLTGTPTEAGRHAMIYTALDADGDRATLEFTIAVEAVGNFDLDGANGDPFGIAYANGRFHVLDIDQRKVYAYRSDGRRDPAADFDLHLRNNDPAGIAYANGRFYVVNTGERKVYAYREDGQRDASADFDLAQEVAFRIAYANGRFYVLDLALRKVYAYREDGQRDASADFDLHGDSDDPHGIAYADGRVYVVDIGQRKVYTYRDDGQHEPTADFDLHRDNGGPFGIAYANGRLYVVDRGRHTVFAYGVDRPRDGDDGEPGGGTPGAGAPEPFDLHEANPAPFGIAYANDRFHVVDLALRKVYAYGADGQRDPAADFDLDDEVEQPFGIVHVNGRLYILDNIGRKVYAYTVSGQRVASADFNLHADNDFPTGIAYANGRFHVVDLGQRKVYAYRTDGQRDASVDFDLHEDQWDAWRITYANGRFYVLTETQSKVFAYGEDGQRDPTVEFDLHEDNSRSNGIAYVNGRFYIVDLDRRKVYAYREAGQGNGAGSSGTFDLHRTNREPFGIAYANDRLYVVNSGDLGIYPYSTSGQRDTAAALDLDEANGYPGGIVYANGRFLVVDYEDKKIYAYSASGQRDRAADFDLHLDNDGPQGIAYANGRFYVVENGERRVYAYRDDGQRDASVEFDLHEDNDAPYGIAYANGRFYVVDHAHNKVFAYGADGQRDATADFDLHEDHEVAAGITYGDGRFYVVDTVQSKVYAYPDEGDEGAASGVPIFSAGAPINSLSNGLWGPGRQTVSAPGGPTYTAGTANTNSTPPSLGAGTALSVEITQCSGQQASPGSPGLSVGIEGTVRADAALSSVVVSGFGNGSLAGIDSLGSLAAGESRHFAIAETILAPQGALSCSVIAEYFDIGALARGEPVRAER